MIKKSLLVFYLSLSCLLGIAQKNNISELTIKEIMQGSDFIGHLPSNVNWSSNSDIIYFDWNPEAGQTNTLDFIICFKKAYLECK